MGQGFSPLDRQLETMAGWSERAVEEVLWVAQAVSSYREAEEAFARLAHLSISKSTIQRIVEQYGGLLAQEQAAEAKALWESGAKEEGPPPPREEPKEELGVSLDGMMVWVDDGWHEAKVGSCFEFGPGGQGEVEARHIGYRAGYEEVEDFRRRMWGYAYQRGLGADGKAVVLGDGAAWIDGFAETYCPNGERIVDWYHAVEHLWALGKEAFGEKAAEWVEEMKSHLWQGEVESVVKGCAAVLAGREDWSEEVARTADYFRERVRQMRYPEFRAAGYPIGSGTVESGCKGIAWRCKNRGQRWKSRGLVAILALRSAGMGEAKEWDWAWEQIRQAA